MGNNQSILPSELNEEPWVMLTYDPGTHFKNFEFYETFKVYSNKSDHMRKLTVAPTETGSGPVAYNLDLTDPRLDKTVTDQDEMTIKDLVEKLFEPKHGEDTTNNAADLLHSNQTENISPNDADKVKILFNWLTKQNIKNEKYKLTHDFNSVSYQLQKLKDKKNSYAAFFSLLCSYAKIPCVIIQGHVKGGRYEFDKYLNDDLIREWNAVLVDQKWRLVDCFWGCKNLKHNLSREQFYLFPDPEHLKFSHFPENETWQLLNQPITTDQFLKQPLLKHYFFDMNMEIISHEFAEIRCEQGEQEIVFRLKSNTYYKQHFLCAISRRNENKEWEFDNLPRDDVQLDFIQTKSESNGRDNMSRVLEALTREDTHVWSVNRQIPEEIDKPIEQGTGVYLHVKVRFPETGIYKLEIIGRPEKDVAYDWVAIYYVHVPWVPIDGWGPNQYLKKCGLEAISHLNGEIECYIPTWLQIKFKLRPTAPTEKVRLRYKLKQTDVDDATESTESDTQSETELEEFKPNKEKIINIKVLIKTEGEYIITISATLNETDKGEVVSYRIVAKKDPKVIEDGLAMEAQLQLERAISSNTIEQLEDALNNTNPYKGHRLVTDKYFYAAKLRGHLINYNKALKRIVHIDKCIDTIKRYRRPKQEIVSVMRAMFILLGEPSDELQTWDDIKPKITRIGENNFKHTLDTFDKNGISEELVSQAKAALNEETTLGALQQSEDIAAMVYWMESVFVLHKPV